MFASISNIFAQRCSSSDLVSATKLLAKSGSSKCQEVYSKRMCKKARLLWSLLRLTSFEDEDGEDETSDETEEGVSNINWNTESDGKWALNCDWPNKDLTNASPMRGEDCSKKCGQTSGCTHYSWTDFNGGTCWMKQGGEDPSKAIQTSSGSCGYLGGDRNINWNTASDGKWALNCDWPNKDLTNASPVKGEDCSKKCVGTPGCTHFTWTDWNEGTCWMKQGGTSPSDAIKTSSGVCGYLGSVPNPNPNNNWPGTSFKHGIAYQDDNSIEYFSITILIFNNKSKIFLF